MLKPEFELLSFVKENQPCTWIDVINCVSSDSERDANQLNALLRSCLETHHWIEKTSIAARPPLCTVRMTDTGEHALLSELETLRQDEAKQAKFKHDQRTSSINTVVGILSLIAAVVGVVISWAHN